MITFAIPTWNRREKLEALLQNLTTEIYRGGELLSKKIYSSWKPPAKIHVCDNASTDDTVEMLEKWQKNYPDVITFSVEHEHVDWQRNFGDAFLGVRTKWTWQMGDDDGIVPGAIPTVMKLLNEKDYKFIHVAEKSRCSGTKGVYEDTFAGLSKTLGFVEYSGFLSGNICDTKMLQEAYAPEMMDIYGGTGSYALCALMYDRFCDEKAAYVDLPLVVLQDEMQTLEAQQRWGAEKVVIKYASVVDAWDILVDRGKLTKPVPPTFIRYMTSDIIAKIANAYQEHAGAADAITAADWDRLYRMADYLEDGGQRKAFLDEFRPLVDGIWQHMQAARKENEAAGEVFNRENFVMYPFKYLHD